MRRGSFAVFSALLVGAAGGYVAVAAAASTRSVGKGLVAFDFLPGSPKSRNQLFKTGGFDVVNVNGSGLRRIPNALQPAWSPDGKQLTFVCSTICSANADGSGRRRLAHLRKGEVVYSPSWSPDGKLIAYACGLNAGDHVCTVNAAGGGARTLAPVSLSIGGRLIWSPDSKRLLAVSNDADASVIAVATGRVNQLSFLSTRFAGVGIRVEGWTTDNRLVFSVRRPSHNQAFPGGAVRLYSVLLDGSGQRSLPAGAPVRSPQWSPGGREFLSVTAHPPNLQGVRQLWTVARDGRFVRKVVELPKGYDFLVFAWQP